jgi:hypothetical protein
MVTDQPQDHLTQGRCRHFTNSTQGNEKIVMVVAKQTTVQAKNLPHDPLDSISSHGIADFFRRNYADPRQVSKFSSHGISAA